MAQMVHALIVFVTYSKYQNVGRLRPEALQLTNNNRLLLRRWSLLRRVSGLAASLALNTSANMLRTNCKPRFDEFSPKKERMSFPTCFSCFLAAGGMASVRQRHARESGLRRSPKRVNVGILDATRYDHMTYFNQRSSQSLSSPSQF